MFKVSKPFADVFFNPMQKRRPNPSIRLAYIMLLRAPPHRRPLQVVFTSFVPYYMCGGPLLSVGLPALILGSPSPSSPPICPRIPPPIFALIRFCSTVNLSADLLPLPSPTGSP